MAAIRVLIADDHTIVREGLVSLLQSDSDLDLVGQAQDGREALRLALELEPDVVVMDISMPVLNGLEAARQIRAQKPQIKIVVLSIHNEASYVSSALRVGANGYVLKSAAYEELKQAIQTTARGETYLSPSISTMVVEGYVTNVVVREKEMAYESLTPRQRELLQLIAEGRTRREIAKMLGISPKTVSRHREDLMHNLNINDDAGLVRFAVDLGIVDVSF
ncbi:MAG: response regulator transcription factor [Chloroflexi bacterium]|nr:response regulator transcription factor [Chloroflexota bacterium]